MKEFFFSYFDSSIRIPWQAFDIVSFILQNGFFWIYLINCSKKIVTTNRGVTCGEKKNKTIISRSKRLRYSFFNVN